MDLARHVYWYDSSTNIVNQRQSHSGAISRLVHKIEPLPSIVTGAKNLWLDRSQTQEENRLLLVCWMGKVPNRLLMLYCVVHGLLQISSCIRDTSFCNRWQRKTHCQVAEHKRRHTNCSSLNGTSVSHPLLLRLRDHGNHHGIVGE